MAPSSPNRQNSCACSSSSPTAGSSTACCTCDGCPRSRIWDLGTDELNAQNYAVKELVAVPARVQQHSVPQPFRAFAEWVGSQEIAGTPSGHRALCGIGGKQQTVQPHL